MQTFARFFTLCILMIVTVKGAVATDDVVDDSIPEAMPMVEHGDGDTLNFLIFGTATTNPNNPGLSDMLMLVTVHRSTGAAAMLAIPRDLWVHIPGFGMHKINTAYYFGEVHAVEGGGLKLLQDTIRYNLGINIDFYAHVNFNGFLKIVDTLGGINLAVDCVIEDWKLKEPHLDKQVEENWEMFTMPIGIHHMDSHTALWYVRSRRTSSDIDRGRRQQDVMRAMWRKVRGGDMLVQLPAIWGDVTATVDTNVGLTDALGMLPFALSVEADRIESFRFKMGTHIVNALSPAPEYRAILVPQRQAVIDLMQDFVTPPAPNQLARAGLTVQIVNASGVEDLEYVAADRLTQEGFVPVIIEEATHYRNFTSIYDFTGEGKNSPVPILQDVLRVTDEGVVVQPDPERRTDYKIYIGNKYVFWSCTRAVIQPDPIDTRTASSDE